MENANQKTSIVFINQLLSTITLLGIVSFVSSLIGGGKYITLWVLFQDPINLQSLIEQPDIYYVFFSINLIQRIPILLIWIFLFIRLNNLYRQEDKLFKSPRIYSAINLFLLGISIVVLTLSTFSIVNFYYEMLLGELESDFLFQLIGSVFELLIWTKIRNFIIFSSKFNIKRKKWIKNSINVLIFGVSVSILAKLVFVGDELQLLGFSLDNYYVYYMWIFGTLAGLEIITAMLYLSGGLLAGFNLKKETKQNRFVSS